MSEYIEEPDTIRNELIDNGALSDKRMNEYIITCDEETASWIGNDVDSMRPLVRCRDCKYIYVLTYDCYVCSLYKDELMPFIELDDFCSKGKMA